MDFHTTSVSRKTKLSIRLLAEEKEEGAEQQLALAVEHFDKGLEVITFESDSQFHLQAKSRLADCLLALAQQSVDTDEQSATVRRLVDVSKELIEKEAKLNEGADDAVEFPYKKKCLKRLQEVQEKLTETDRVWFMSN